MNRPIFRQKALERLASPENLHELVQITSPRSWLVLIALGAIIFFFLLWSVVGEIPKTVRGQGILIQSGGITEVTLLGSGIVSHILVEEGQEIKQGDTLAIIAQPELQLQMDKAKEKLNYFKAKRNKIIQFNLNSEELSKLYQQKYDLQGQLSLSQRQERTLEENLATQEELFTLKNIGKEQLNQARMRRIRAQRNTLVLENEVKKVNNFINGINHPQANELESLDIEINDLQQSLDELEIKYTLSAYVRSPYQGKVIELMTKKGQLIEQGTPVASLEVANPISRHLEAIIYVAPDEGKKIDTNMMVRIAPSTVKVEEYGYIEGEVIKVSEYPSTRQGMAKVLGSSDLVQTFAKTESPIAVVVKLKTAKNKSGYQWTSAKGPNTEVKAGTLCEANIVVSRQKPISLMFPAIE
ncbi:MAG: NHLP bacteriocin system secretion protein [Microscillaceae bacterium]|jgi:HlyD family secretion protein|nr:NHLP bacteriocin system secretion protein [Microscillaceae bacterium]